MLNRLNEWERALDILPEGFFIGLEYCHGGMMLSLYYKGEKFEDVKQPGGESPAGDHAYVLSLHTEAFYLFDVNEERKKNNSL